MKTQTERLTFCYLMYTANHYGQSTLLRIFKTKKAALASLRANIAGDIEEVAVSGKTKRVGQIINQQDQQIWYIERHVLCNQ